jgi:hypothetical protein
MALWRDGVWQAILEVRALAALPAIPLDREPLETSALDAAIAYLSDEYDDEFPMVARLIELRKSLRGALPVLETKKEES